MDLREHTLFYRRAANLVMYFGSILTVMVGVLILITTLALEMMGYAELANGWFILSSCSMFTSCIFWIGIALAIRAYGRAHAHQQQETASSGKA